MQYLTCPAHLVKLREKIFISCSIYVESTFVNSSSILDGVQDIILYIYFLLTSAAGCYDLCHQAYYEFFYHCKIYLYSQFLYTMSWMFLGNGVLLDGGLVSAVGD